MANVSDVCRVLEELAPVRLAETWDNVGLLLGHRQSAVSMLMTCLTLTERVAEEAIERGVQMVVTHHPIFFRPTRRLTDETAEGRLVMRLMASGVAVYSAHTAFDNAACGINQQVAELLGLIEIRALRTGEAGSAVGSGRMGRLLQPMSREAFLERAAGVVGAKWVQCVLAGREEIRTIGIACGSAGEYLSDADRAGCDTFVTGEARFHTAIEAESREINLVLLGHYASERFSMLDLAAVLAARVPGLTCFASEEDRDPLVTEYYPQKFPAERIRQPEGF